MIRTILVPLDGSAFGEQALPLAFSLARRANANVELLHVHTPVQEYSEMLLFDVPLDTKIRKQEKRYLENMIQKVGKLGITPAPTMALKEGHVPDVVNEHALAIGADLVVMTTHARGPMGRFWLGSVADRLIREMTVPVLFMHPREAPEVKLDQDVRLRNILIPLDGSPACEGVLGPTTNLARVMESQLTLIRVIKPLLPMTVPMGVGSFGEMAHHMTLEVETMQENIRKDAAAYLETIAQKLRKDGFQVTTRVEAEDQPARAILGVKGMDLVAMETHGRRGLSRFFLGSVADKVLRGSSAPVLVCRPK